MKKPFNVLGLEVPVIQKKVLENNDAGVFDPVKKEIFICKSLPKDQQKFVELHELLHAVFFRIGIEDIGVDAKSEELLCNQIATVLLDNFRLTRK